ncbi:UNVERIFIED_CONTAM: hypothetical protein FKN15_056363 [Acipenser sinensis]
METRGPLGRQEEVITKSVGDFTGQLLAYSSLLPVFILVGFVTLIVFKRELHTISFFGGLVLNEGVNWLLKNIFREPRPCGGSSEIQDWVLVVYLLYHSWSQVINGGVAGSIMAVAWFIFTQELLTPLFPKIAAWPISEFFLIRDTSLIPNILWFEYTVTRTEARYVCKAYTECFTSFVQCCFFKHYVTGDPEPAVICSKTLDPFAWTVSVARVHGYSIESDSFVLSLPTDDAAQNRSWVPADMNNKGVTGDPEPAVICSKTLDPFAWTVSVARVHGYSIESDSFVLSLPTDDAAQNRCWVPADMNNSEFWPPTVFWMDGIPPKVSLCEQKEMHERNMYRSRMLVRGTELALVHEMRSNSLVMCDCDRCRGKSPRTGPKPCPACSHLVRHCCILFECDDSEGLSFSHLNVNPRDVKRVECMDCEGGHLVKWAQSGQIRM